MYNSRTRTQIPGKFCTTLGTLPKSRIVWVLLSYPYPNPGHVWYYSWYPIQIPGGLGITLRTLPEFAGWFGTTLGTLLYPTSGRYLVSTRDLGIYQVPGTRRNGVLVTSYCQRGAFLRDFFCGPRLSTRVVLSALPATQGSRVARPGEVGQL